MTSIQLVGALLDCGVTVYVINRRHMMHSKLYGKRSIHGDDSLVVTSGNFSAPGLRRNIESLVSLSEPSTAALGFDWHALFDGLLGDTVDVFSASEAPPDDPRWALLYDEETRGRRRATAEDQETDVLESMIVTLSHADTARIGASPGTEAAKGSQYFWLSKDCFDFFPPLTIRNTRGRKATYSTMVDVSFLDIGREESVRVTFEAENNLDFRLGTGPLRGTRVAKQGDMAVLSRRDERRYELSIVPSGTSAFFALSPHALIRVGAQDKRYGYAPNADVDRILGR